MKKQFWPILLRTAAVFLAFWALMMGVLSYLNLSRMKDTLEGYTEDELRREAAQEYEAATHEWEGSDAGKPAILSNRLSANRLYDLGGFSHVRVYDNDGREVARSQLAACSVSPPGTGTYSIFLLLDPVLTDDEQLALADLLEEGVLSNRFFGTDGGLYDDVATNGLYGEVVGILDEDAGTIYPQKLTYHYKEGPITVMESSHAMFDGKQLTTIRFDSVRLHSQLQSNGSSFSNRHFLEYYHRAVTSLDDLLELSPPSPGSTSRLEYDGATAICGTVSTYGTLVGSSYVIPNWALATYGLFPTYVLTLLAALLLAWFISSSQFRALRRERDLTNAVAHELKTPLSLVRSYAEGLSEDIAPEKHDEYLDVITDESDKMASMVNSLLDLSRLESGKATLHFELLTLEGLVQEVFQPLDRLAEKGNVCLSLALAPCLVRGDREQLTRLISNLASNALRHCTPGGEVSVSLAPKGGQALLQVENDGEHISPDVLPRLFEPFYKADAARERSKGGTGLGLTLVQEIATRHGGSCGVANRPTGVRFWCSLPLCHDEKRGYRI